MREYPSVAIGAAAEAIGLRAGHQGSTEMGHLIISAGRNVLLPQLQIQDALSSGSIFTNAVYVEGIRQAKKENRNVHLMGLLSDAGVHSYDTLLHALLKLCANKGLRRDQVFVHVFSDGRDTPPDSLVTYIERLQAVMQETGVGVIATLQGRFWAMDRDKRWERVEAAYRLLVQEVSVRVATSIEDAIEQARAAGETDEFIAPTLIDARGRFQNGDTVINFNHRVDREIEITQALIEPLFDAFERNYIPRLNYIATLPYYENMSAPSAFVRAELSMDNILPEVLSARGYSQFRVTETEKWVYVTKIFNGMKEAALPGEERLLIPSDQVERFDAKPEMKALEIATAIVERLQQKKHDVVIANICNADMLGHTGNYEATVKGCEVVDRAVALIYEEIQKQGGVLIITADHGNAEIMHDEVSVLPHTQHTSNAVPFVLFDAQRKQLTLREDGALQDVAPTLLEIMNIELPAEMTGRSLIEHS